ncbi:hypothetical protein GRI44_07075 [Altererythrobacter confluentis]|uniref:Uncharacterized protein n=1 Tax=Allopontixanthobacter confluentis TaxID=1849021 RepID=A0A6L7GEW8_9SPHN|nr:hypothetical protein [Allopontixanthobacter confluentis]MXP14509.1 hypothetical protein [Allopontixanthobacter confluentis]
MTKTYLSTDCEFAWDEDLYEAHRSIDRKSKHHAIAVKRVIAAATFEFAVDDEGRVSTGAVSSWTEHQFGDEQAVVSELFCHLRMREEVPILTYGGLATDIPVLLLASMGHQLPLPHQLTDQPGRKGPRPHLDLGLMLKGGGRTWSHLSQVLLRIGVPTELVSAKASVSHPKSAAEWKDMRDHVELDTLLLAIAKIAWLVAQGTSGLRFAPAVIALIAGFLRRRSEHRAAVPLREYSEDLQQSIAEDYALAA